MPHAADPLHAIRPTGGDRLGATHRVDLHAQLESSLVHIHSLTRRIDELKTKYENELAKDEAARNALRADVRNRLVPPG